MVTVVVPVSIRSEMLETGSKPYRPPNTRYPVKKISSTSRYLLNHTWIYNCFFEDLDRIVSRLECFEIDAGGNTLSPNGSRMFG
jgi:hypothetical protein